MKRHIAILTALALLSSSCIKENAMQDYGTDEESLTVKLVGCMENDMVPGSVLVKVDQMHEGMFAGTGVTQVLPALKVSPRNESVAREYGLHQWYELKFDESASAAAMARKIAGIPSVKAVQFNSNLKPIYSSEPVVYTGASTRSGGAMPFDDPMLADQWNLINDGDRSIAPTAVAGADVGVKDAWNLNAGDPRVVVAVFDEGVLTAHPDLRDAMWINAAENGGTAGVDDDGNGYVDDVYGYNFAEDKGRPSATGSRYSGHGTHVAGTIAATNNNGEGVSSIAGGTGNGDGVRIMSCQIFRNGTKASDRSVADAFIYAADNGACIAQCSYGSEGGAILSDKDYINGIKDKSPGAPLEYAALQYFMDPRNSNCEAVETNIAVFAAGNNSGEASSYPGALPFCISVTAFGPDFLPGGYSNRGPGCDIAAPGGDPWIAQNVGRDQQAMILSTGIVGDGYSSAGYAYNSGTSMACPHVSGVVALGMSYALELGQRFSREEFISMLLTSVNDIDQFLGSGTKPYNYSTFELSSYKGKMGTGAVDAWRFLNSIEGIPSAQVIPGQKVQIDLRDYLGETPGNFTYTISIDSDSRASLGITSDPVIRGNMLEITCSKTGSGRITLSSSVGKDETLSDGISGLNFSRTISIVSRPVKAKNGGWL